MDQDIYTVMGGAFPGDNYRNALFLNPGTTNHWLKLKLEGTTANRAAIGAHLRIVLSTPGGPREIYKPVNSGASFGSNPLRQELGLGDATAITAVEVLWPGSGTRQVFRGLEPDRAYQLRESAESAVALELKRTDFDLKRKLSHRVRDQAGL